MGRLNLQIELVDELIFSQRSASLGGHGSLHHIPGAALLGVAAARLYKVLTRELAWAAFHSGKLRFGDGLPVSDNGSQGWPMPLCWHHAKGETIVKQNRLVLNRVFNLMHCPEGKLPGEDGDRQPKQLREGYVTADGQLLQPDTEFRMRTAINPGTGRAAEAQLFGFQSLAAGQRFHASVDWDKELPALVIENLKAVFDSGDLLLGRSRSAQFGRARCTLLESPLAEPALASEVGEAVSLWLLSDLAANDANGMPTLTPTAADLGLPWGNPVADKTYTRIRSYAPYNTHHQLYGRERQVIAAGSVLSFKVDAPPTASQLADWRIMVNAGLGLYRESGLGRVVLEPELLRGVNPVFSGPIPQTPQTPRPEVPVHPFAQWVKQTTDNQDTENERKRWAEQAVLQLVELELNARALAGLGSNDQAGPGKSQWGRVSEVAKTAAQRADSQSVLHTGLFDQDNGICKPSDPDWGRATQLGNRATTFADWLHSRFAEREAEADAALCLGLLANLAQKRLNR